MLALELPVSHVIVSLRATVQAILPHPRLSTLVAVDVTHWLLYFDSLLEHYS